MTCEHDTFSAVDQHLRRRYYISRADVEVSAGHRRGWRFQCDQEGLSEPYRSSWEEWFFEILRYPEALCSEPLTWKRHYTAEIVDLKALQPSLDGVEADSKNTPESLGLPLM